MMNKFDFLKKNDNFLILTHKKPDGDTTGSASALCQILRKYGKTAFVLPNEDITPKYEHLVSDYYPNDEFKQDCVLTVDTATRDLLTPNGKKYEIDFSIDHHFMSNTNYAKENVVLDYAACGEIIFEVLEELGVELDESIATAIYYSISTDTGCFKYSNTTANTHIVAAKCLPLIKAGEINRKLFDMVTRERIELEQRLIRKMEFYLENRVCIMQISRKDINEAGAVTDDLDSIASLPRSIEGVEVGITLTEQKNGDIKVSARSSGDISVSEVCGMYGGGGHLRAAGVTFTGENMQNVQEKMILAVKKVSKYA